MTGLQRSTRSGQTLYILIGKLSPTADLQCVHLVYVNFSFQTFVLKREEKEKREVFRHPEDSGQIATVSLRDAVGGIRETWGGSEGDGHCHLYTTGL